MFEFLAQHNYCHGIMAFTALTAFIYSLRHYRSHPAFRIIPYYIGCCLVQTFAVDFYRYVSPPADPFAVSLERISTVILTIFEFCVFSSLILHFITGRGRRLAIKVNIVLFFMVETFLFQREAARSVIYSMCLTELIALALPCIMYFYELFTNTNTKALKDRPSFWIVIGISCLGVFSLTSLLTFEYVGRFGEGAYMLGDFFYCVLFVFFMRAYKASPPESAAV